MDDDGGPVNVDMIGQYVEFLCERGVHGLFVVGTTGEGCLLSVKERRHATEAYVKNARGRAVVVPQCGSLVAAETIELVHHAAQVGADGAAVVTPFYFSYPQQSLYEYYARVLEAEPSLPIYAYNIPQLTNNAVDVVTLKRLARDYANFCGVKESSGNAEKILQYVRELPKDFAVIAGSDSLFLSLLFSGIQGCVSGPGSVIPEIFIRVYSQFTAGRLAEARASQAQLADLSATLGGGSDLDLLKRALQWRGLHVGSVRAPLPRIGDDTEAARRKRFESLWTAAGFHLKGTP